MGSGVRKPVTDLRTEAAGWGHAHESRAFHGTGRLRVARQEIPGGGCERSPVTRTAHHIRDGHSPHLSHTGEVADVIAEAVART